MAKLAKRKRSQTTDDDPDAEEQSGPSPLPLGKSARHASKVASTMVSSKSMSGYHSEGSYGSLDSDNIDGSGERLSNAALVREVMKMAENQGRAELMILELMRKYSFKLYPASDHFPGQFPCSSVSWNCDDHC